MLLLTIYLETLTGCNDIVSQLGRGTFGLPDQRTKTARAKNNKLVYICLLFVQDKNQDMLMQ